MSASNPDPAAKIDLAPLGELLTSSFGPVEWSSETMPGGASTRSFFRVGLKGQNAPPSIVAFFVPDMNASDEIDKTDGARQVSPFVEVQGLLKQRGVRVPEIYGDGGQSGWLVVEDLGDATLAEYLKAHPESKEGLYKQAVADLARAQQALASLPDGSIVAKRAFDQDLLEWEIRHFREWAVEARGLSFTASEADAFNAIANTLAKRIASWTRGFVHRDYQSRNLMVKTTAEGPRLVWIDFQDSLLGPRIYDLVALLNDSYQTFTREFVEERLGEYANLVGASKSDVISEFDLVTVQRKLKDAGRFVFIERKKNNPSFLSFVEPTIKKAQLSLTRLQGEKDMQTLAEILQRLFG